MTNSQAAFSIVKILRFVAALGTLVAALGKSFSTETILPNQHYSFIALLLVGGGVVFSLLVFLPKAGAKILKNSDILVPAGLYVTADYVFQFLIQTSNFYFFKDGAFNFADLTGTIIFAFAWQIVSGIAFSGWTTRAILQLIETGKVDLIAAFQDYRRWFPRTLAVVLLGGLPIYLFLAVFILPFMSGAWNSAVVYPLMLVIGATALLWNLATALLLPFVLSSSANLRQAIVEGIGFSWKNKSKTILPVVILMILSGWIVVISVHYTKPDRDQAAFGAPPSSTTTEQRKFNVSTEFVWTGSYVETSKWHKALLQAVEAEPLSSVDFRLMLLMLLLSVAVKITIIGAVWRDSEAALAAEFSEKAFGFRHNALAVLVFAAVCLLPFELIFKNPRLTSIFSAQNTRVPNAAGVIKDENLLKKQDFFATGQGNTVDLLQKGDEGKFEVRGISSVAVGDLDGKAGRDVVVATGKGALILDTNGTITGEIPYQFENVRADMTNVYFTNQIIVDIDRDGVCEFVGYGGSSAPAGIYNHAGKLILRFSKDAGKDEAIVLAAGTPDNEGVAELFSVSGGEIKPFTLPAQPEEIKAIFAEKYTVFDDNGDGNPELLTDPIDAAVKDANWKTVRKIPKPFLPDGFLIETGRQPVSIFFGDNFLGLFDFEGNLRAKYAAPLSEEDFGYFDRRESWYAGDKKVSVLRAQALRVKFFADRDECLAVMAHQVHNSFNYLSMLYIYDSEGEIIYQELFDSTLPTMFPMPGENDSSPENLLIADDQKIWRYAAQ